MLSVQHNDAQLIKNIFQVIDSFVSEVKILCTENGFKITAIDDSHICMINMHLPSNFFENYELSDTDEHELNIDTETFVKLLSSHRSGDTITLSYSGEGEKLLISMQKEGKNGARGSRNFSFSLLDNINEEQEVNLDNLLQYEMQNNTYINPNIFDDSLKAAKIFGEVLDIIIRKDVEVTEDGEEIDIKDLVFRCRGNLGELEDIVDPIDLESEEDDSTSTIQFELEGEWSYTISFLKDIIKSKTFSERTKIYLGKVEQEDGEWKSLPIRFDFQIQDGGELNFFLAPRKPIESTDDFDEEEDE